MLNVTKTTEKTGFCIKTAQFQILTIQNTFKYTTAVIYTGESRKHPRNYGNQWQLKQKKTPLPPVNAPGWQRHKSRYFTNIYTIIEYIAHKISRILLLIKVKYKAFFIFTYKTCKNNNNLAALLHYLCAGLTKTAKHTVGQSVAVASNAKEESPGSAEHSTS